MDGQKKQMSNRENRKAKRGAMRKICFRSLVMQPKMWSYLVCSFTACFVVINLVTYCSLIVTINDQYTTKLMTKNMTKLMITRKTINDQTKYDHIFCRVIRDQKLATNDRQSKNDHLYANIGHFFVTYLSLCTSETCIIQFPQIDVEPVFSSIFVLNDHQADPF